MNKIYNSFNNLSLKLENCLYFTSQNKKKPPPEIDQYIKYSHVLNSIELKENIEVTPLL
jgi:hypothetical protein